MYIPKIQKVDLTFIVVLLDALALFLAGELSQLLWLRLPSFAFSYHPERGQLILAFLVQLWGLRAGGAYMWIRLINVYRAITRIVLSIGFSFLLLLGLHHLLFLQIRGLPEFWLVLDCVLAASLVITLRWLLRAGLLHFAREQVQERIAFAGWGRRLERVLNGLKYNLGSLQQVLGFIEVPGIPSSIFTTKTNYLPVGQLKDLEEILKRDRISLMIVDDNCLEHEEMQEIAAICSRCLVSMNVVPRSFDIWLTQLSFQVVGGVPLMGIHGLRHSRLHNRMIKRTVDIVGSLVGLLLSAPIISICAYLIKRESPGPIFYSQTRLGRGGRPFTIYKLRSMRVDAEKDNKPGWTIENDPRRLKIGTFMRKWNIDETPQFWNVLKGDMSLVGPRPERPELAEAFSKTIRHYNLRHTCKPGVTGWAAVNGLRGNTSLVDRLEYDLFYLENWDVLLDFKIMFFTFFPSENAY